ncbi:MAG: sterol desaturase family protein [Candidatus Neomarinimicrobiota bacterium]|jgi:beta-carotene 3-hydroxylase|nr:beta-carotene hydroxylase [Candidatus Neomarinimicrobiota bacterium]MEC8689238.1 sterol desaturase family protein [Candidatus Neomarinimicrobiota bacterium]MEC8705701.1 sterol desaturase family protein [Candidatus Neomarinimicrobiota bacterium]|tara:strand:- start:1883 stop:2338 length:456 start_codon:yes stop_codon:yes gene_type:complete
MFEFLIVIVAFVGMEFAAWATHKYLMHGPLWFLHEDHHVLTGKPLQKNDSFALIFAIPSASGFIFGSIYQNDILFFSGLGILLYGIAYLFVHDIFIHRRIKIFTKPKNSYLRAVLYEHRKHHANEQKENGEFFGMLFVSFKSLKALNVKNG